MKIVAFTVEGPYASFCDPTVTANKSTYLVPPKTSIAGLIGAMIGVRRPNIAGASPYSREFIDFLAELKVGVKLHNVPEKYVYYVNHRSQKKPLKSTIKPVKNEVILNPKYTFYVASTLNVTFKLVHALETCSYTYTPVLGHMNCPARVINHEVYDAEEACPVGCSTSAVILDEKMENIDDLSLSMVITPKTDNPEIIIERLYYPHVENGSVTWKVLRHLIPVGPVEILEAAQPLKYSRYYMINGEAVCLY
ncbi:MAG: CRISPR-associated protein Cas5 [Candidatus Bathyarchaeota archaeon]|nr:CRISPR-associated protein Cas5 [Candidatus Bathyarchaeota archaeon]